LFGEFSPNPDIYTKPWDRLLLKQQPRRFQQIEFGHGSGTLEKQGASDDLGLTIERL
jgi:hypothetical protein